MSISSLQDALDRKNGPCPVCNQMHNLQTQCSREALASKITKLMEANSLIPGLLQQNKQVTEIAKNFQSLLVKADEAHTILMDLLTGWGDIGEEIKKTYLEKLNSWAPKEIINQDICDLQPSLFDQEHLTTQGKKISDSTGRVIGRIFDQDSEK